MGEMLQPILTFHSGTQYYATLLTFFRQSREGELIRLLTSNERRHKVNSIFCFAPLTEAEPSK